VKKHTFIEIAKIGGLVLWVGIAATGLWLNQDWVDQAKEIIVYSLVIPVLVASFFYGRTAGLLVALVSSGISGALALRHPGGLHDPFVQRLLFQIVYFNLVTLVTSSLAERERAAAAENVRLAE